MTLLNRYATTNAGICSTVRSALQATDLFSLDQHPATLRNSHRASGYASSFLGLEARQTYRVINLWEVEVEYVFRQPLPSLVPFVPILKGGNEPSVIQQVLQVLRSDEQFSQLESLLAFFASFVLELSGNKTENP